MRHNGMVRVVQGVVCGVLAAGTAGLAEAREAIARPVRQGWVIEDASYTGTVTEGIARLQALLTVRILQDGWTEVLLGFGGATITKIELPKKTGDLTLIPRGAGYVLAASRKGTYRVRAEFAARLAQDGQYEGLSLAIPQATFSTLELTVPKQDVELRESDRLYVQRQPDPKSGGALLRAALASAAKIDVRWSTKAAPPAVIAPMVYGDVATVLVFDDQLVSLTTVVDYRVAQGEITTLTVAIPAGVQVQSVRGSGIEDWKIIDGPEPTLHVTLNFPLRDASYRLVIEGEQHLEDAQPSYAMPAIRLLGVKQERGQVAVASAGSLEITAGELSSLTRIDVRELSEAAAAAASEPVLLAFRYHQHPYTGTLALTHHDDLPVLSAIAEQGELVTVLSPQGELMTRATYLVRANKKPFLGVILPKGATLWSCLVDGRSVKPAAGEAPQLLVPLARGNASEKPVLVELVYFESRPAIGRAGRLTFHGPLLDVPTTVANWMLLTPDRMRVLTTAGNLEEGLSGGGFIEDAFAAELAQPAQAGHAGYYNYNAQPASSPMPDESAASTEGWEKDKADGPARMMLGAVASVMDAVGLRRNKQAKERESSALKAVVSKMETRMRDAGILPLKIRLPKSGRLHRFNRLMTAQEALELQVTFVQLPAGMRIWSVAGMLLLVVAAGAAAVTRRHRTV